MLCVVGGDSPRRYYTLQTVNPQPVMKKRDISYVSFILFVNFQQIIMTEIVVNKHIFNVYDPADMSKRWHIEWYDGSTRIKKYTGINKFNTYKARMKAAKDLAAQVSMTMSRRISIIEEQMYGWIEIASKKKKWRESTAADYKTTVKALFAFIPDGRLSADRVEAFFVDLSTYLHPSTYNKYRLRLKNIFEDFGKYDLLYNVEPIKGVTRTPARYFQSHQIRQLTEEMHANDTDLLRFVQFQFYCFIRPKELRSLTAGHVLLEEGKVYIDASFSKNKKSQYVVIPDSFLPELDWVKDLAPGDFLFPSPLDRTKQIGRNTMSRRHKVMLRKLRYGSEYKLYSWKHTGAVHAVKAGIGVKELQIQLRHHSLDETDKYLRQLGVSDIMNLKAHFPAMP